LPKVNLESADKKGDEKLPKVQECWAAKTCLERGGKKNSSKEPCLGDALRQEVTAAGIDVEDASTRIQEEDFLLVDGLRFALPYFYDFRMHAKKRMVGRLPVDVFAAEFPVRSRCAALASGTACMNVRQAESVCSCG
jgi:hypothetical protein